MPAYKYEMKDGKTRWYASFHYVDWMGKKKRKVKRGFLTRKDAQEYERHFLNSASVTPDILFSSLVENYLADIEPRVKPNTYHGKRYTIDTKFLPYFKDMKISDITPVTIRNWQHVMIEHTDEKGEHYGETYLNRIHAQLSTIMNYAVRYYGLKENPCRVAGGMGHAMPDEMKIWTREEFERFLTFEVVKSYRVAFEILFYTGIREGELLALTKLDIPEGRAEINIDKTFATIEGEELFLEPKTAWSKRVIPIHRKLHDHIMDLLGEMYLDDNDRIFYFKRGSLLNEFKRVTGLAGLEQIRIHDLRHSHASMLFNMDVPIAEISKRLGHKSPRVTLEVYSHMYKNKERNIAQRIDDLFKDDSGSEKDDENR